MYDIHRDLTQLDARMKTVAVAATLLGETFGEADHRARPATHSAGSPAVAWEG